MGVPTKRQFTDEFKREAVALWQTSGRLQTEVAREIGIQPTMLRRWKEKIEAGGAPPPGAAAASPRPAALPSPADQASEIARLKRELDRVKMERDVLKRAIGIFLGKCRGEISVHPRAGRMLSGASDVPGARRLPKWLLSVARSAGKQTGSRQPTAAGRDPPHRGPASWPLWHPPLTFHLRCRWSLEVSSALACTLPSAPRDTSAAAGVLLG